MLEAVAQVCPLAGGRLQVDRHAQPAVRRMNLIEGPGDPRQAGFLALHPCASRDERPGRRCRATRSARPRRSSRRSTSATESSSGLPRLIRYEVWATGSTIPVSSRAESKRRDVLGRQGRGVPLVVVLGEELNGLEVHGVRRPGPPGRNRPRSTCERRTCGEELSARLRLAPLWPSADRLSLPETTNHREIRHLRTAAIRFYNESECLPTQGSGRG